MKPWLLLFLTALCGLTGLCAQAQYLAGDINYHVLSQACFGFEVEVELNIYTLSGVATPDSVLLHFGDGDVRFA